MRAIKKIVALATGATMIGATVMGAMAADLAEYPAPFVSGCDFDGAIVVGDSAAAEDVIGAVDISSTLAVSGTSTSTSSATTISTSGEVVKIETGTNKLNLGDNLTSVTTVAYDKDDLPTILADGEYKADDGSEYSYEQKIEFEGGDDNGFIQYTHFADSDYKDKEPALGIYVKNDRNFTIYTLDFTKDVVSDLSGATITDMVDTEITIMGKTYDITKAKNTSNSKITLTLMGGAIRDTLEQGQQKTYTLNDKEYDVEVVYIGGTTSEVKMKINGELTKSLKETQTDKLDDGTIIGIRDIMEEEAGEVTADQVEFYIGAEKLVLEDSDMSNSAATDNVELNDEDVDDLYVDIEASGSSNKLQIDKIILVWRPDEEIFITEEQNAVFPLGAYQLTYKGTSAVEGETTEIKDAGNKEIELVIPLKSGTARIPYLAGNGTQFTRIGGEDSDEQLATITGAAQTMPVDKDLHESFVATYLSGADCSSYLLKISSISDSDGVTIKDVVTGQDVAKDKKNATSFTVGDVTLTVDWLCKDNNTIQLTAGTNVYFDRVCSKEGLLVYLPYNLTNGQSNPGIQLNESLNGSATTYEMYIIEEDKNGNIGSGEQLNVTLGWSGKKAMVSDVDDDGLAGYGGADCVNTATCYYEIGDTDEFVGYAKSELGSKILYDKDPDQDTVKIIYYGEETYGNAYVAETGATFGAATSDVGTSICKVSVPPALLASEVSDVSSKNLILVGGPCANAASASVMGVASTIPECLAGFEEGKAKIKMYDTGAGKVAMLVAGMTALDTRRASRVLKNYEDYALSGDEVEVTGTSLTDISVSSTTAA